MDYVQILISVRYPISRFSFREKENIAAIFDSGRTCRRTPTNPQQNEKTPNWESFHFVAGSGIEPESGGYEPPEVPLL